MKTMKEKKMKEGVKAFRTHGTLCSFVHIHSHVPRIFSFLLSFFLSFRGNTPVKFPFHFFFLLVSFVCGIDTRGGGGRKRRGTRANTTKRTNHILDNCSLLPFIEEHGCERNHLLKPSLSS